MSKNKVDDLQSSKISEPEADRTCINRLKAFTQETSFGGLQYIGGKGNAIRKSVWFLVVLLALAGLMFQIVNSAQKFIDRPTSTKLSYIPKNELEFPSVTLCNTNMFRFDNLIKKYGTLWNLLTVGVKQLQAMFPQLTLAGHSSIEVPDVYPGNVSLYNFILTNAHTKETTIKSCRFDGEDCGPQNFTTIVTNNGVCFTFDSPWMSKTPGKLQGLSVILDAEDWEHIAAPNQNTGFFVLIHGKNEVPNMKDYGIELDIGKHTSIRIETTEIERLSAPYGSCVDDDTQELKYFPGKFTKSKCFLECETDVVVSNCSCRTFYMPGRVIYAVE
ncbi:acid-sensing ion channel 4-A-like [Amphiura filiformis]|uniref:acid-sensing ion channel 4-A-like n=1 Tax=Amphiura filiformis TaxID=82378 RepID=UPI003B2158DC